MSLIVMCVKCRKQVSALWAGESDRGWPYQQFTATCHGETTRCDVDMTQLVAQNIVRAEAFSEVSKASALPGLAAM